MKQFFSVLLVALLASCSLFQPSFVPSPGQIMDGKASYVIDGNTFYFSFGPGKFKVKLAGVETPGMKEQYGKECFEFLRELVHQKNIRIEYLKTDAQGRWIVNATLATGENVQDRVQAFAMAEPDPHHKGMNLKTH